MLNRLDYKPYQAELAVGLCKGADEEIAYRRYDQLPLRGLKNELGCGVHTEICGDLVRGPDKILGQT